MNEMSSFKLFDFEVSDQYTSSKDSNIQGWNSIKESQSLGTKERVEPMDNITTEGITHNQEKQSQMFSVLEGLDSLYFNSFSPRFQSYNEGIKNIATIESEESRPITFKSQKEETQLLPLTSLGILNNYQIRLKRLTSENIVDPLSANETDQKSSTDDIIRMAGKLFVQSYSQRVNDLSLVNHPFPSSFSGLSDEFTRDVHLVGDLLLSAEKVGQQQYEFSRKLLKNYSDSFLSKGSPVQRLVYYFSQALQEKINRETGRILPKKILDLEEAVMAQRNSSIAFNREVPFSQAAQYGGMQAIFEKVVAAKKVHVIDLVLMNGSHIIILMQALAVRCNFPLEHLKVTAVGTKSKQNIEETGKRLMNFSESINLSFSFNVVVVEDMLDLNESLFDMDPDEAIAVHSSYLFSSLITRADRLDCLMRVIRNINPCIMVVNEVEANLNSSIFVNRFVEALFFYGALFDSLEDCMEQGDQNRLISESVLFYPGIYSTVALDGDERTTRHVNINVWRTYFARFGMVEVDLSWSSLYQAKLVVDKFACSSKCTLDKDGKCLIIGWKGTPLQSLSGWKFPKNSYGRIA